MMLIFYIVIAILTGCGFALKTAINAKLSLTIDSWLNAAFFSLIMSAATILVIKLFNWNINYSTIKNVPLWLYISGGVLGAFSMILLVFITPKLGISLTLTILIASQVIIAAIFDHFGVFGLEVRSINIYKITGIIFLLAGVLLTIFNNKIV